MGEVDELVEPEAVHEVVRQHRAVGVLGLADGVRRARVVEEQVVHQARPPRRHPVGAAEPHVADEGVPAPVVVAGAVVCAEAVFL